jgi:hypothetical protein
MQIAFAVVVKFVRCWCRETAMAEVRRVEEKRRSGFDFARPSRKAEGE